MDRTPKTTCQKCHSSKVYRVNNPYLEGTDTPRVTDWKEGLQTWNCSACNHQWAATPYAVVAGLKEFRTSDGLAINQVRKVSTRYLKLG